MEATAETQSRLQVQSACAGPSDEKVFVQCPSCNISLRQCEVAKHCEQETNRLRQKHLKSVAETKAEVEASTQEDVGDSEQRRKPWTVFQRVQRNRQTRLKQRTRKRPAIPLSTECPMCNVSYSQDEIQRHADQCLRRSNSASNGHDADSSNDEENDGEVYEEYEWAGQKRIRVSSLLRGGYAAIGVGQTISQHNGIGGGRRNDEEEDDEDLNVDEDDTQIYGPSQYDESNVIAPEGSADMTNYMRRLITGDTQAIAPSATAVSHNETNCIPPSVEETIVEASTPSASASKQIIDSLKDKLRHYENHVQSKFKCLICLDDYRKPAISVSCWHVHCEECWLRSLGARKLCPQCNLITTPKDLRRIYM